VQTSIYNRLNSNYSKGKWEFTAEEEGQMSLIRGILAKSIDRILKRQDRVIRYHLGGGWCIMRHLIRYQE
jgi:hypothetical protein